MLGLDILDTTNHVERVLRDVVVLALEDLLESVDGLLQGDQSTLDTSEDLGDGERLRHESLNLSGSLDGELVLLRQLIHTHCKVSDVPWYDPTGLTNGNDILERLVRLQDLLRSGGNIVVSLTDDSGVQHSRLGVERVNGGVDTQLGDTSRQHSGGVQVGEGGGRSGIGQIIGRHVDGLDRGNRTLLGGGNSLLHTTHIGGEGRLVSDSGRNSTEQGRHLGTGLGESENVVNEKQDILSLLISEVLGNGKTGKSDSGSSSWGLVHLTEDESDLGVSLEVDDTGLSHFVVQIVTLSSSLTDTGEDRVTTMGLGNVVDQLLNQDGFTDTGTTEKSNLTTSSVRGQQIDDLDTSLEHLGLGRLLDELWWVGVDRELLDTLDRSSLVNGLSNDVHDSTARSVGVLEERVFYGPKSGGTDGNHDGVSSVDDLLTSDETIGTVHGNGSDSVLSQVLSDLENKSSSSGVTRELDLEGVQDRGKVVRVKVDIDDGTNDSLDGTGLKVGGGGVGSRSG